jgi:hypothetical protein
MGLRPSKLFMLKATLSARKIGEGKKIQIPYFRRA